MRSPSESRFEADDCKTFKNLTSWEFLLNKTQLLASLTKKNRNLWLSHGFLSLDSQSSDPEQWRRLWLNASQVWRSQRFSSDSSDFWSLKSDESTSTCFQSAFFDFDRQTLFQLSFWVPSSPCSSSHPESWSLRFVISIKSRESHALFCREQQ